jgi:hypothetical protein
VLVFYLLESGERAPAHAAGEENLDTAFFEEGHGRHAPALFVRQIFKD